MTGFICGHRVYDIGGIMIEFLVGSRRKSPGWLRGSRVVGGGYLLSIFTASVRVTSTSSPSSRRT